MNKNTLTILGCGGHARSVADVALTVGFDLIVFIDKNARQDEKIFGFNVYKDIPKDTIPNSLFMPASGDNIKREKQIDFLIKTNRPIATIISKTASVGFGVKISSGCFIGHHTHIGPLSSISTGCIINTSAVIEHDCQIGEFSHVSVNSSIAGNCNIGKHAFIGVGATIIDNIKITDGVTVGAGGVVVKSINSSGVYIGVPAKKYPKTEC